MTTIRRIPTSKIDGNDANADNTNEIRPYGEIAVYVGDDNKLELLMFDGVRTHLRSKVLNKGTFYGGDADSGDGEGLDTIKLVPDEVLRLNGSNQYIIIDPTEPDHIHIRAGGAIDNSSAKLFLGGENNNVTVEDSGFVNVNATGLASLNYNNGTSQVQVGNEEVYIQAGNFENTAVAGWTFNNRGQIRFPSDKFFKITNFPTSSTGAPEDRAGDIAFTESYIYYCTQDYSDGYEATLIGGYSGANFPAVLKGSYPKPLAGWTFVWNDVTYTLIADATDPNEGQWQLQVDQTIETAGGGTVTLYPPSSDIWRRVAWSEDTW
jgi:hypothetical protein